MYPNLIDISWVSKSQPWTMYIVIRLFLKDRPPVQFGSKAQNLHLYEVIKIIEKICHRHPQQQISQTGNDLGEK